MSAGTFDRAVDVVARRTGVSPKEIVRSSWRRALPRDRAGRIVRSPGRPPDIAFARDVTLYLMVVVASTSLPAAGREAGISRETVRRAVMRIEDLRDDPKIDAEVEALEQELVA